MSHYDDDGIDGPWEKAMRAPVRKPAYCRDCGNPDCPKVDSEPFWARCPATDRLEATP